MAKPKTQTFKTAKSALTNAKKLTKKGDISKSDLKRVSKKLKNL